MSSWYRFAALGLILTLPAGALAAQKTESLESRVERMERMLESKGLMQMMQRQMQLQEELDMLRGQNEVLQHEIKALKERQRELYLDMDRRIQEMGSSGKTGAAAAAGAGAGAAAVTSGSDAKPVSVKPVTAATAAASGEPSQEERQAYKQAFERLKQGRYDASITEFQAFLKKYPSSGYASNAQYWLGEAYYVNKQYPQALEEFKKVINKYPQSSKVSDARLKLGFTYYELGNWDQARKTLKALSKDESGSSISRLADKRLQRMTQEGH